MCKNCKQTSRSSQPAHTGVLYCCLPDDVSCQTISSHFTYDYTFILSLLFDTSIKISATTAIGDGNEMQEKKENEKSCKVYLHVLRQRSIHAIFTRTQPTFSFLFFSRLHFGAGSGHLPVMILPMYTYAECVALYGRWHLANCMKRSAAIVQLENE